MDKNTVIGFVLIFLIMIGFSYLYKPSNKQIQTEKAQKRISDSLAIAESMNKEADSLSAKFAVKGDTAKKDTSNLKLNFGSFAPLATGVDSASTIENDKMKITLSSKGGRVTSVDVKKFVTGDSLPLILFDKNESAFNFSFFTNDNRLVNTEDLYFKEIPTGNPMQIVYRLPVTKDSWMDFIYTLKPGDYRVDFEIKGKNLDKVMLASTNSLDFRWSLKLRQQEKGRKFEERYSGMNYKFMGDDVEKLSESKDDSKKIPNKLSWVSCKDQFFACIAIPEKGFESNELTSKVEPKNSKYIKDYRMTSSVAFDINKESTKMQFYYGPIKYSLLKSFDKGKKAEDQLDLDKIVPLGGKIIRWCNTGIILPMFNLFGHFVKNYGLIIILMTIVIKLIIFPLTYKSYMSSAKMRVLQPQIEEINKKFSGNEKAQERSQATMSLYQRAGVNPMGGCLPVLFQMPVLYAMYSFFPSSIELRQQSFLWANDLSTYDAIIKWTANIPVLSSLFGNHISLFCLLMTLTNIVYTYLNNKNQPTNNQMPGMKAMMYLMPLMFLFMFNQYSSGLSLYFFISTLLSIMQTYVFRWTIDDEKMLAKLNENKKKPLKKSGFAARLEQMQREQQKNIREQQKKTHR